MTRADEATRFKPGQSGNPRGRPRGSRNRLSEKFLAELAEHFEMNGKAMLDSALAESPSAYIFFDALGRKVLDLVEVESGDVLLLIDRERRKVLRSVGSSDPEKTAAWFG
jgi:Family of unknown function (DUF5681)